MPAKVLESLEPAKEIDIYDRQVSGNHEAVGLRAKINTLLDTFERQKLARPKMVAEYRKAASDDKSPEGLKGFYQWITHQWQESMRRLNGFHEEINRAVREGIAGEHDRTFLMRRLILTDQHDFAGEVDNIAAVLREKLDRMKRDRVEYDRLHHHPLIQHTGFLKADAQTKIPFPDAQKFLAMTVPERRALLQKIRETLPKAEAYAQKIGVEEGGELAKRYEELLNNAQFKHRIIGRATADKFRTGFKVIDRDDKQEWIAGFENQMKRYEDLWNKIRTALKGQALQGLEAQRDEKGYTELFAAFGRAMEQESKIVCGRYDLELEKWHEERVISLHTKQAFAREIRQKDFAEQKRYLERLSDEIRRYQVLRSQINALPKRARAELDALYRSPDHGYQEIHQRFLELSGQVEVKPEDPFHHKMQALSGIRRERVRKNVVWSEQLLETDGERHKMAHRLDRLIATREAGRYDQANYATSVEAMRRMRQEKKESLFRRFFGQKKEPPKDNETPAKEAESIASLRAQNRQLEQEAEAGVHVTTKADDAFNMTRVTVGDEDKKVVRFGIGDRRAVKAFLQEEVRVDDRDEIHLMAKEGGIDRMTFEEIRHFRDYLKNSL